MRKDGSKNPVEVSSQIVTLGAKKVILTIARDLTDRKRAEAEIRRSDKLESLGTLAGGIAHDFNNFLTGVVGNLSLVLDNKENLHDETEHIRKAMEVAMRARALTKQLLTFAVGGTPVTKTGTIVDIVADTVEIAMSGSNVKYDCDIEPGTWLVDMDEGQIAQVISNLVINARQSMKNGGAIQIEVKNEVIDEGRFPRISSGRYVCISITDHGEGIPPENVLRIFDPYFSTKRFGYGLGLAASLSIVKNHRGYIDVKSQVGTGSTFHVYLPASKKEKVAEKRTPSLPSLKKKKVLVMDDKKMVCEVLAKMLSRLGGEVLVTTGGRQALKVASQVVRQGNQLDLAILDLTIPGEMGGQEVFQELRKIDPAVKGIVSSGYYPSNVMSDFSKHGFSGVLQKPYLFKDLCDVLNTVLGK
jgi:nitrogen-specific signal transduction histidine kinase/CheY-like chemotaxis protein